MMICYIVKQRGAAILSRLSWRIMGMMAGQTTCAHINAVCTVLTAQ